MCEPGGEATGRIPSEQSKPALPDAAIPFDLLAQWVPDEAMRNRILVDNARQLYAFA